MSTVNPCDLLFLFSSLLFLNLLLEVDVVELREHQKPEMKDEVDGYHVASLLRRHPAC